MSKKPNRRIAKHAGLRPNHVRILPIHLEAPDVQKLGRAFLALALHEAAREKQAQQHAEQQDNRGAP